MPIPENLIDQIQQKTDIVEVISKYLPLAKAGRNYKGNCPFHNEKTPSFMVSPDKQIFHCFGCSAGGNVFSFLMKQENISFPEAVEMLADKAGVALPRNAGQSKEAASLANQLYRVNELATQFFQYHLTKNAQALDYLSKRGIGEDIIKDFKLGYSPDGWDGLISFFKRKGVEAALLEKAGLAIANDRGGHYDRFRKRIMFPIVDLKDKTLGFGARVLDASLPKYMNSPETPIYSKGRNLYGLNLSREYIKKEGHAIIVEGYLDFIIPFQSGAKNLIATLGTALTAEQVKLLKRFSNTVVMVYDPDEAGEAASLRNTDIFIAEDVNVYIAELPAGYDPDSFIQKFGLDEFHKLKKAARNIFDYKIEKLSARFNIKTPHGKAAIAAEMLPTISRISNAVMRASMMTKLSEKLGVEEGALKEELKKVKPEYGARQIVAKAVEVKKDARGAQDMILAILLEGGAFIEKARTLLSPEEFKNTSIRDLVKAIFDIAGEGGDINPSRLISHLNNSPEAAALISEAASLSEMMIDKEKVLADCIARIKKDNLKDQLEELRSAMKLAQDSNDDDRLSALIREYDSLIKINKA
jgi:DNA primase